MKRRTAWLFVVFSVFLTLQGCKHPLAIVGEGDIVEAGGSGRGCSLEQYRSGDEACTANEVSGAYHVNYKAVPRSGWRFVRWDGPCPADSDFQHCRFDIPAEGVAWWDENRSDEVIPPTTAVFEPITGETGLLLAGTPVAGVTYETPTQQGVTDLEGRFQYAAGERVRFMIGATVLGEVAGKPEVTPFDLAGSPALTGLAVTWALQSEDVWYLDDNRWAYYNRDWTLTGRVDPFHAVINLAVLLHSLDQDGDPANGIVIRSGTAGLLNKVQLGIYRRLDGSSLAFGGQDWKHFQNDPAFRHVMGIANRRQLFSAPHRIVKPAAAIAGLYDALGIDPRVAGLTREQGEGDEEGDWENFAYNAGGNVKRHEISAYGGGYETWQYDRDGNVTRHEEHADSVGHHRIETWQYDGAGNLARYEDNFGGNVGAGTVERTVNYTNDADGNLRQISSIIYTDQGELREDEVFQYVFDSNGNLERLTEHTGGSVRNFYYTYDTDGSLTGYLIEHDRDADGTPEKSESWQFNSRGDVALHMLVSDGDRQAREYRYTYDTAGKMTRREMVDADSGSAGNRETWQFDAAGRLLRHVEYYCAFLCEQHSREWLESRIETWQYDADNRVSARKISLTRYDVANAYEQTVTEQYSYDGNGRLARFDSDSPYPPYLTQVFHYDAAGRLVRVEGDADGDDPPEIVETWDHDAAGNLTRYELDRFGDGQPEKITGYRFKATGWGYLFSTIRMNYSPLGTFPFRATTPGPYD